MDPYTEYLTRYPGTGLARSEPSYRLPQPRPARQPRGPRASRWRLRPVRR